MRTIKLSRPIEAHGEQIDMLELHDLDLGGISDIHLEIEMEELEEDKERIRVRLDLGDLHKIVSAVAQIPRSSARRILFRDLLKAKAEIADFLGFSR